MVDDESKKSPSDKRKHIRVDAPKTDSSLASIKHNDTVLTDCKIINLSAGGVAVVVRQPNDLEEGSRIENITVKFPGGGGISSPAIVRHVARETDTEWNKYGIDVEGWLRLHS